MLEVRVIELLDDHAWVEIGEPEGKNHVEVRVDLEPDGFQAPWVALRTNQVDEFGMDTILASLDQNWKHRNAPKPVYMGAAYPHPKPKVPCPCEWCEGQRTYPVVEQDEFGTRVYG